MIDNEKTRGWFLYEVTNNDLIDADASTNIDRGYQYSESIFSNLAKNINLFDNLIHTKNE